MTFFKNMYTCACIYTTVENMTRRRSNLLFKNCHFIFFCFYDSTINITTPIIYTCILFFKKNTKFVNYTLRKI
jgi:hypothetical protein